MLWGGKRRWARRERVPSLRFGGLTLGLGNENCVPLRMNFLRTPKNSAPPGPTVTSTFSIVMFPQRGQNRRPASLVTKKQAEQRSAQRLNLRPGAGPG